MFTTHRRVEFGETDLAGILHFSNFFRFMEAAETDFLHSKKLSVHWTEGSIRYGFPRVSASCDFAKPAFFEDVLAIDVTLEKIGTKSLNYRFDFKRGEASIASGRIAAVFCRSMGPGHIESIPITEMLRQQLEG